jgi:hypothetical protein
LTVKEIQLKNAKENTSVVIHWVRGNKKIDTLPKKITNGKAKILEQFEVKVKVSTDSLTGEFESKPSDLIVFIGEKKKLTQIGVCDFEYSKYFKHSKVDQELKISTFKKDSLVIDPEDYVQVKVESILLETKTPSPVKKNRDSEKLLTLKLEPTDTKNAQKFKTDDKSDPSLKNEDIKARPRNSIEIENQILNLQDD